MYLCLKYDLRWPIIVDRYTLTPPRTTEQLQERYYGIVSRIKAHRAGATEAQMTNESYTKFDVSFQKARRTQLELALRKLKGDEEEEVALKEELKNIDAELKRRKTSSKKDKAVIKEEAIPKGGSALNIVGSSDYSVSQIAGNRRVGSGLILPFSSIDSSNSSSSSGNEHDNIIDKKKSNDDAEFPSVGNPRLQSSRLVPLEFTQDIAKSLTKKMSLLLNELGMPENPLPTRAVCDLVDVIRKETATLLSIQNVLHKKEMEISHLKVATQTQINDYTAMANQSATNNAGSSSSSTSDARATPRSFEMPHLMTTSDTEIVIPQSMLTNSEYVAAPTPPVKEKAPIVTNTKRSTSIAKRKSAESSGIGDSSEATGNSVGGGQVKDTSSMQPATKKSKKS